MPPTKALIVRPDSQDTFSALTEIGGTLVLSDRLLLHLDPPVVVRTNAEQTAPSCIGTRVNQMFALRCTSPSRPRPYVHTTAEIDNAASAPTGPKTGCRDRRRSAGRAGRAVPWRCRRPQQRRRALVGDMTGNDQDPVSRAIQACRNAGLAVADREDCTCELSGLLVVLAGSEGLRLVWPYEQRCRSTARATAKDPSRSDELAPLARARRPPPRRGHGGKRAGDEPTSPRSHPEARGPTRRPLRPGRHARATTQRRLPATPERERSAVVGSSPRWPRRRVRRGPRRGRHRVRRAIEAESYEKAAEPILEPDPTVRSMLMLDLLQRIRGVGPAQAERMLELADVSPTRTHGALTARRRAGLAAPLRLRVDQLSGRNRRTAT
jgi:hypothetical protein